MKTKTMIYKAGVWVNKHMDKYGIHALQYSLAIIFLWFGLLKPLGLSPAADLIAPIAFWLPEKWFIILLGCWEIAIGVLLFFRVTVRFALILLFLHIPGTFLPFILLPEMTFTQFPFGLTLEGQYIVKNLILIAAAITVGGAGRWRDT